MSEESPNSGPRDIFSTRPFWNSSREYYRKGFLPFPLPARKKNPPPDGVTGHNPKVEVEVDQIDAWMDDAKYAKANVGVKLDIVTVVGREDVPDGEYIVIGIDVDNYDDYVTVEGEKKLKRKEGGEQLAELEERFGKLPETWISSARADGVSGIRFFLAPTDLQWRGKAADSIDVIQPGHRFAVVWPSWHPEGGQYLFTQPGQVPDGTLPNLVGYRATTAKLKPGQAAGKGRAIIWAEEPVRIPDAREFPMLPDKWVDFLTRDKTAFVDMPMNMDLSVEEMERWAKKHMRQGKPCKELKARVAHWKERIEGDPASHDKVLGFHWQIAQMGLAEGHAGCWVAIKEMNDFWMKAVQKAGKRGPSSAAAEIFRSKINAFRKVRYLLDEMDKIGAAPPKTCHCGIEVDTEVVSKNVEELDRLPKPPGYIKDVDEYEPSDWGRSEMFLDMFTVERVKCVGPAGPEVKWYFWELDGTKGRKSRGWVQDNDLAVRLVRAVGRVYRTKYEQILAKYVEMRQTQPDEAKKYFTDRVRPARLEAERIGNQSTINPLLRSVQSHEGVRVPPEYFDSGRNLLGFEDGVLVLDRGQKWKFRDRRFDDFVTKSTGLPFRTLKQLIEANDPGVELLRDYMKMFIPDPELAEFVQIVFGYSLFGSNFARKIFFFHGDTSTGKSTIVESIVAALGDYGGSSNDEIFNNENGGRSPEMLKTWGKRIIQTPEFGESSHVESDALKRLASEDTISVRDNYAKSDQIVEFNQTATFIGPTNNVPKINGLDQAVAYRVISVPFNNKFEETAENLGKTDLMKTVARAAVLAWAVEGWNKFVAGGQVAFMKDHLPRAVALETKTFLGKMSAIGEFIEDYLEVTGDQEDRLAAAEVYSRYQIWAEREGTPKNKVYTQTKLSSLIGSEIGSVSKPIKIGGKTVRGWVGVKMTERSSSLKNSGFKVMTDQGLEVTVGAEPQQA